MTPPLQVLVRAGGAEYEIAALMEGYAARDVRRMFAAILVEVAAHFTDGGKIMRCEADLLDLAGVGYHAYGDSVDWTNHAGNPMPTWAELPEPQRAAWVANAAAIHRRVVTGGQSDYERSDPMMHRRSGATGCCKDGQGAGAEHVEVGHPNRSEPGGRA